MRGPPADELPGDLMESYHLLWEPAVAALRALDADADYVADERPSIHQPACYLRGLNPAHDVVSDGGDGRKLAGNAQHRQRAAVVQPGSISLAVDAEEIRVVADLPGVDRDGLRIKCDGRHVTISASTSSSEYEERIELPGRVDEHSASASFNNGILEITLDRVDSSANIDLS